MTHLTRRVFSSAASMAVSRKTSVLGAICLSAMIAAPVVGQSLADRMQHVGRQRQASAANKKAKVLGRLVYTDLSVEFNETPAREAFDYMRTLLGINLVARYNDDRSGIGIDPEELITLTVQDESALTIIEMMLAQVGDGFEGYTWQIRDGVLEVGPKSRLGAKSAQEIRYYPIRDLLFEPPHWTNAPDFDLDAALQQGNSGGGGSGSGGGGGGGFGSGGGGGGSGGGGSGGGGGGGLFGDPDDNPEGPTEIELAEELIGLIQEVVEPEGWESLGGDWGTIRYYQGTLIVRAPDFMQRQIGGYPFAIRPTGQSTSVGGRRYVSFSGGFSQVEITGIESQEFSGAQAP